MRPIARPGVLDGIVVVLDRPRDATNVGAVVRAMGNFGLSRLRLVEPAAYDEGRILAVAHRGRAILDRLERHPSLDSALADCIYVLGTTARPRTVRHERMTPRQAAPALLRAASLGLAGAAPLAPGDDAFTAGDEGAGADTAGLDQSGAGDDERSAPAGPDAPADTAPDVSPPGGDRHAHGHAPAAILFGPEDRGLSNEALGRCNAVVTIPTAPEYSSLNLAQATLLIAYELWLAATDNPAADTDREGDAAARRVPDAVAALEATTPQVAGVGNEPPARVTEREEMLAALEMVLWGMHPNNDAGRVAHTLARLRAVLLRAAPRAEEVRMLTRLFVHIAHERESEVGSRKSEV